MEPNEISQADLDFEDDAEFEAEDWDEEALGLDWEESEAQEICREISSIR